MNANPIIAMAKYEAAKSLASAEASSAQARNSDEISEADRGLIERLITASLEKTAIWIKEEEPRERVQGADFRTYYTNYKAWFDGVNFRISEGFTWNDHFIYLLYVSDGVFSPERHVPLDCELRVRLVDAMNGITPERRAEIEARHLRERQRIFGCLADPVENPTAPIFAKPSLFRRIINSVFG